MSARRLSLALAFALLAPLVPAQEATLTTPVTRTSEAKQTVRTLNITQAQATIEVSIQDSSNAEIRVATYVVPDAARPTATVAGVLTALDTARSGETGGAMRRANFRILGFLQDNGYLPAATLVP